MGIVHISGAPYAGAGSEPPEPAKRAVEIAEALLQEAKAGRVTAIYAVALTGAGLPITGSAWSLDANLIELLGMLECAKQDVVRELQRGNDGPSDG